jgi:hypothetical protein
VLRTIVAVAAGYLVFAASAALLFAVTGRDPHQWPGFGFLAGSAIYVAVCSIAAGAVAARVSRCTSRSPAAILAIILAVIATASMMAQWRTGSVWSEMTVVFIAAPAIALGGRFGSFSPS